MGNWELSDYSLRLVVPPGQWPDELVDFMNYKLSTGMTTMIADPEASIVVKEALLLSNKVVIINVYDGKYTFQYNLQNGVWFIFYIG